MLYSADKGALYLCPAGKAAAEIPETVGAIYPSAFQDCKKLTSITIPDSVEDFYGYVFEDCTGLTTVTFPTSLARIGRFAF